MFDPIELDFDTSQISKPNWLRMRLENLEKKSSNANSQMDTPASSSTSSMNGKDDKDDPSEIAEFREDLMRIVLSSDDKSGNKLVNFGNSVKTANTSKACVIS